MNLTDALQLRPRDIVAFVGAGGKTSSMFRLAAELAGQGWRVITTTTTRLAQDELRFAPQRVGFGHGMRLPENLPAQVEQHRHVFVFTRLDQQGKVIGVRPKWLDDNLAQATFWDFLLVEADGARRQAMKAPLPHEPALPALTTVVVPVVGIDVLGQPMDENTVYGAQIIEAETGYPLGQAITPELIAGVLINPRLALKNVPERTRVLPLINKVDEASLPNARLIARYTLTDYRIEETLIGAVGVNSPEPIFEVQRRVGVIILAAGESRRMGQPKLMLPWGDGTIIRRVAQQAAALPVNEVVLVAGRLEAELRTQVADLPIRVVGNPLYADYDMTASLQAGLNAIWSSSDTALILLGDQPGLDAATIERVLAAYLQARMPLAAPFYNGERGHPLLIDRALWPALMQLPLDKLPREVIQDNAAQMLRVPVSNPHILQDIDTPQQYEQARKQAR